MNKEETIVIVGDLRIVPVGSGSSMEQTMEKVVEALEENGVSYDVGPLGTTLEAESLNDILNAVKEAHEAACTTAPRVMTELSLDQRLDKEETARSLEVVS